MYDQCPIPGLGILPIKRIYYLYTYLLIWGIYIIATLPYPISAIAPKYETAYACEGKTLTIECDTGDLINLIRANYGRFSITICNDHGNVDWSVNCMSAKSLRVLHSKCSHKQNCSVLASTNMFGDPCPGTHKYLEAHYQCVSAAQTSTTTNRPSPPWLITSQPSVWSTSTVRVPTTTRTNVLDSGNGGGAVGDGSDIGVTKSSTDKNNQPTTIVNSKSVVGIKFKPTSSGSSITKFPTTITVATSSVHLLNAQSTFNSNNQTINHASSTELSSQFPPLIPPSSSSSSASSASSTFGNGTNRNNSSASDNNGQPHLPSLTENVAFSTQASVLLNTNFEQFFCGPRTARNLFWNLTRVGEVNVQPCPGGATGIAKWRCVYAHQHQQYLNSAGGINRVSSSSNGVISGAAGGGGGSVSSSSSSSSNGGVTADGERGINKPVVVWQPATPDLTHCRSLWLNSLEVRVNQRDSSLISIANDLSLITNSKTLYGGDMLVTTKIIQIMSEKMTYDIETFPDQRQREEIILELLHGVVKTGSNLLDSTQHLSWLDLSFEDQMRVATSLLTGLEDNAFLLADTIVRERNVVQKDKNILLSVRVLETRNIVGNEIFPDATVEQWNVSDDSIELPRGALIENSEGGLVRIVFVAFDRLETILKPSETWSEYKYFLNSGGSTNDTTATSTSVRNRILNSKVISASLGKGRHIQLSQPIRLILKHLKIENVSNPMCVFWNYIDHAWSEDGCYVEITNKTHTICMCNHLTNFAILMDIVNESNSSLLSIFDDNMRILIYISIAICILFIIVALLTLKLFSGIFVKSSRTTIYKNMYICLVVVEILFLFGIEQSETSILCGFTTAFLHCAFLCAVAWVFFEVFQLYITLTTEEILLEVEKSSRIIWYYLMSYGASFTIVAISLVIDPGSYTQAEFCLWTESNYLFYLTFVSPVFLYILATVIYSVMSTLRMCKNYKTSLKNKEHTRLASVRFYHRCSIIFLLIFAACWTFGYLYMANIRNENSIGNIFGYFFVILNALQGFYIFGFHCMNNEKIRREYRKYMRQQSWLPKCLQCSKSSSITSSSPNNQHPATGTTSNIPNAMTMPMGSGADNSVGVDSNGSNCGNVSGACSAEPNSGGLTGTLSRHHNSLNTSGKLQTTGHRHNIIVERVGNSTLRTGIGGPGSPTSSAGSTHLIYNASNQPDIQPDWNYHHFTNFNMEPSQLHHQQNKLTELVNKNFNTLDDKFVYYDRKQKKVKQQSSLSSSASSSPRQQPPTPHHLTNHPNQPNLQEEYFYWTEKSNKRRNHNDLGATKSDAMHSIYPSYKKKMHYIQSASHPSSGVALGGGAGVAMGANDKSISENDFPGDSNMNDDFRRFLNQRQQQQLNQMSPNDDMIRGNSAPFSHHYHQPSSSSNSGNRHGDFQQQQQRHAYYHPHHSPINYSEEPVYEEIINSRGGLSNDDDGTDCLNDYDGDITDDDAYPIHDLVNQQENTILTQSSNRPLIKSSYDFSQFRLKPSDENVLHYHHHHHQQQQLPLQQQRSTSHHHSQQQQHQQQSQHLPQQRHQQPQSQHHQQQQQIGRNLSAMLDENNTVICYLEPMPKEI